MARNEETPEPIERFLARRDDIGESSEPLIDITGESVGKRYFREKLLEVGDDVFVYGKVNKEQSKEFDETHFEIRAGASSGPPVLSPRRRSSSRTGHEKGSLAGTYGMASCKS